MRSWMAALVVLIGCGSDDASEKLMPIPGTTTRIGEPVSKEGSELYMELFTERPRCEIVVSEEDVDACMPYIDRATGEVRLSFQLQSGDSVLALPLAEDHIRVAHMGREVKDNAENQSVELIPHEPQSSRQLFILLIDGSASMREEVRPGVNRMDEVRSALLLPGVKDAFFPDDNKTAVAVFEFTEGTPEPLGGKLTLLENKKEYTQQIRQHLRIRSGYTHLYDAIRYVSEEVIQKGPVYEWLQRNNGQPTVVALTDGFNNIRRLDKCGDNAQRLTGLLGLLQRLRKDSTPTTRPSVYTVGLGRPLRPSYTFPDRLGPRLNERELCGRFVRREIDGDLERQGIDNVSLKWIAYFGGGRTYVRRNKKGLGEAFQAAAAKQYEWFEVRYRYDPYYMRRSFETRIRLTSFASAEGWVQFHPSAWLDAPPGAKRPDGWAKKSSYRATLVLILPILGTLTVLSYLGAAWFNTRRVLSGRTRPPRPPKAG
ncbi:MAG: vWA domain-containing protein [Myxococcota bacterium]